LHHPDIYQHRIAYIWSMEHLIFALNNQQLEIFSQGNSDITTFLCDIFSTGSSNYQQLAYELQREFKQGGSPEVTAIAFDRVSYDAHTRKGSFRIVLSINFTFGCEDVKTEKQGQTSEWTFAVDLPNSSLDLYSSPFAESRSTADEF
jgi:hypothetical protein